MQTDNHSSPERHVGLIDYGLALLDHWKVLVLVPIVVGAIAFGILNAAAKKFTSVAIVSISVNDQKDSSITPAQAAAMMKAPSVLEAVLASNLVSGDTETAARQVSAAVSKEGLVRLEADGPTPEAAQKLANVVLAAWFKTTLPGEREAMELQARAAATKANLANVNGATEALARRFADPERAPADVRLRLADLAETADKLFSTLQAVQRRMLGLPPDVVRQPPTLPDLPSGPRPVSTAIKAALGAFAVLALVVVMRRRLEAARSDPVVDAKLRRYFGGPAR
ncbi:Wzz/FepE/Etk N-terminal domain-containing protein [Ramlibacter algicola]|uniref:Polysaccharide chain length determinant N-terminal domain-containing protein n=1 Tax=Ramlibacter algicola TaxID=2795217 RepID=A0A934UPV0_9BURK|nr:Wzz/FepE/Etk N-terminal domain-containing protein [Ramlibacter algicola]MBK0391944.1 hypothetical protein [Ramlibacter algicola]